MLAPIAKRMSTPRKIVNAGMTMMPPPSPNSEPNSPAAVEATKMMMT